MTEAEEGGPTPTGQQTTSTNINAEPAETLAHHTRIVGGGPDQDHGDSQTLHLLSQVLRGIASIDGLPAVGGSAAAAADTQAARSDSANIGVQCTILAQASPNRRMLSRPCFG